MVVLNKIRSASLMEALTASVIIVVVFMIATFSFNNILQNGYHSETFALRNAVKQLEYKVINDKIKLPVHKKLGIWELTIDQEKGNLEMEIYNSRTATYQYKPIRLKND